jgi:hypothetical protein
MCCAPICASSSHVAVTIISRLTPQAGHLIPWPACAHEHICVVIQTRHGTMAGKTFHLHAYLCEKNAHWCLAPSSVPAPLSSYAAPLGMHRHLIIYSIFGILGSHVRRTHHCTAFEIYGIGYVDTLCLVALLPLAQWRLICKHLPPISLYHSLVHPPILTSLPTCQEVHRTMTLLYASTPTFTYSKKIANDQPLFQFEIFRVANGRRCR